MTDLIDAILRSEGLGPQQRKRIADVIEANRLDIIKALLVRDADHDPQCFECGTRLGLGLGVVPLRGGITRVAWLCPAHLKPARLPYVVGGITEDAPDDLDFMLRQHKGNE